MKSVLRHQSVGFTALAAIALCLSACSAAEGSTLDASDSVAVDATEAVTELVSVKSVPASSDSAASVAPTTARVEQAQTAPAPRTETAAASEQPVAAEAPAPARGRGRGEKPAVSETPVAAETPVAVEAPATPVVEAPADATVATPETTTQTGTPSPATEPAPSPEPAPAPAPVHTNTMRVVGNQLFDSCGQPFVVRGVEQILGNQLPQGNDWLGLVRQIASTGANAVRILPGVNTLTTENVDEILTYVGEQGMVAFIDPLNSPDDWYARADVKAMLKKHESFLIIDAYGEPQYDDVVKWRAEAKEALVHMRSLGYEVPFTVYANQFGRGLPSLFDYGAEILAADPLHNTFLGWQAYWGNTGYYQEHYGYSLEEAVQAIVDSGLPIQLGLDHITDLPSTEADYGTLMQAAEANGVGWLWWDFYNPYGAENNLTEDGSTDNLTATGADVLVNHPASIAHTAKLACGR